MPSYLENSPKPKQIKKTVRINKLANKILDNWHCGLKSA